jgi:alanyl-tRNA synthetase
MLGNFSIGDYFKAEMVPWAHEFLTETLGLPQDRLWPAVFEDDDEAYALWQDLGYPEARIMRYGEEDNYWFSGDVGPCGPDSEVHYDFGEQFGCGPDCHPAHDCPRFVEIWNLVFMTYYRDGENGLPCPRRTSTPVRALSAWRPSSSTTPRIGIRPASPPSTTLTSSCP